MQASWPSSTRSATRTTCASASPTTSLHSSTPEVREQQRLDADKLDELRKQLADMKTLLGDMKTGTQNVRIVEGTPRVDPQGQAPVVQR